jgi:hypothetical protein
MKDVTRRSFVSQVAGGVAALSLLGASLPEANAQLVWKSSDWKLTEFHALVKNPARIKQVYDVTRLGSGKFLNNIKNSLNGLHYGFGIPNEQIKIAAALHGPANMLNYDDYIWQKYEIGAWLKVTDPQTGQPAVRNPFYKSRLQGNTGSNPDDPKSSLQDTAVETLQSRGVQFLSCHTATEEQARALLKHNHLNQQPEEIVREMLAHTMPGVMVVASMVAAVALLQAEGHYSYITV